MKSSMASPISIKQPAMKVALLAVEVVQAHSKYFAPAFVAVVEVLFIS